MGIWGVKSGADWSLYNVVWLLLIFLQNLLRPSDVAASFDTHASPLTVDPALYGVIYFAEDQDKSLDPSAASALIKRSSLTRTDIFSRVYSDSRYWMALSVEPISVPWVLNISSRTVSDFTIFILKNGQWQVYPCRLVSLSIHPRCIMPEIFNAPQDILVRMEFADTTAFDVKLESPALSKQNMSDEEVVFNVLLTGVSFALILFLGIFGWSFRDIYYYYFALYALSFVLYSSMTVGFVSLLHGPWTLNKVQPYLGFLSIFFSVNFASKYLNMKILAPRIYWIMQTIGIGSLSLALLRLLSFEPVAPGIFIECASLPVLVLSITAGVRLRRSGLGGIGYFILAWSVFSALIVLILAKQYHLWTSDSLFANSLLRIASTVTLAILAISVAKRAQVERSLLIQKLRDSNTHLESEVQARTKKIVEQQEMIVQSAKMASLGEMAAGIAHEINNPLAIISGSALALKTMLARGKFNLVRATEFSNKVETATWRISGIVKSLRNLAHQGDADSVEDVDLSILVGDLVNLVSERFKNQGIDFQCNAPSASIFAQGQLGKIEQILISLLNNAFDAISQLEQRWIRLDIDSCSGFLMIHVTDSGSGIPLSYRDKIFDPFFTTKDVGKGTGLGLPLSRRLAESMNGSLTDSIFEGHTRFSLKLPMHVRQLEAG